MASMEYRIVGFFYLGRHKTLAIFIVNQASGNYEI